MRWLTWNGLNNRIMFGEIIVPYIIGGSLFGLLFELLVNKDRVMRIENLQECGKEYFGHYLLAHIALLFYLYNMFKKRLSKTFRLIFYRLLLYYNKLKIKE